jgi:hypothetical protein
MYLIERCPHEDQIFQELTAPRKMLIKSDLILSRAEFCVYGMWLWAYVGLSQFSYSRVGMPILFNTTSLV